MQITAELLRDALADQTPALPPANNDRSTANALDTAVVVPVYLSAEPRAVMILRAADLKEHGGEVGFPGGKPEPGDADLWGTATREMAEEIGLNAVDVTPLGKLTPIIVISGRYRIHPFVASLREGAAPRVESREIARIIEVPLLPWFTGEAPILGFMSEWRGHSFMIPHFELEQCILYGASAYIFYELLVKLAAKLGCELPSPVLQKDPPWGNRYAR